MIIKKWNELPDYMRCNEVRPYYDILYKKRFQIVLKRLFDLIMALIMIVIFAIPMVIVAVIIKLDSPGPVFFRQERVTLYGRTFRIHKFRTMVNNAEKIGTGITAQSDTRVTHVGKIIRKYRIDEIPQLIDVIEGTMSFVGTRPETPKFVKHYTNEMFATFLMPAGITSEASIRYKDETKLLNGENNIEDIYVNKVLPEKMYWNLNSIVSFSILSEMRTMLRTVLAVLGKEYQ